MFVSINMNVPSDVEFEETFFQLEFVDHTTSKPIVMEAFELSIVDLDMATDGDGRECALVPRDGHATGSSKSVVYYCPEPQHLQCTKTS